MIVALDIDDTITRHPQFFALLSRALHAGGHRVLIITFREHRAEAEAELAARGVVYDELITADQSATRAAGLIEWKAAVCRRHDVDIFFEDSPEVIRAVDERTLCLMPVDRDWHDLDALCHAAP